MEAAHEAEDHSVAEETWQKLLGSHNWEGLLDPLDLSLRKFILRCGDLCHTTNDTFLRCDSSAAICNHDVELPDCCEFISGLYTTPSLNWFERYLLKLAAREPPTEWDYVTNWMGYCATTTDDVSRKIGRREIYIAWRGTKRLFEWRNNLMWKLKTAECLLRDSDKEKKKPRVVNGWLSIYTSSEDGELSHDNKSARDQVKEVVGKLLERYKAEKISVVVTGHSLGAALAVLTAFDLVENEDVGKDMRVAAVVFGCPRIGTETFRKKIKEHSNLNILHVRNKKDIITHMPPVRRVGTELVVDSGKLKIISKISKSRHDLETCLCTVAAWNGPDKIERGLDRLKKANNNKKFGYSLHEIKIFSGRMKEKFFPDDVSTTSSSSEISDEENEIS